MPLRPMSPTTAVVPPILMSDGVVALIQNQLNTDKMKRIVFFAAISMIAMALSAQVKVVAHRGFWHTGGSAQNSLASFSKADSIGVYGSEIDVWLTVDGELMVNHDKVFKGLPMETTPSSQLRNVILDNGEKMPTLDEYLSLVKTKTGPRLVLEMKSLSDYNREDEAAAKIVKALKEYDLLDRTDIIAFSLNAVMAFRKLLPEGVKIFYLDGDLTPAKVKKMKLDGIDYSVKVLKKHPEWVRKAHESGIEVNVWTVNTEEDMKYFIDLGVDYITTDHPDQLLKLLNRK